jgi:hypothetical protein
MTHLEFHPHAFINNDNVVGLIAVFLEEDHNTVLIEQVQEANGYKEVICCCTFGQTSIGAKWTGSEFIPPQPFDSWIWNDSTKEWVSPIPLSDDELIFEGLINPIIIEE